MALTGLAAVAIAGVGAAFTLGMAADRPSAIHVVPVAGSGTITLTLIVPHASDDLLLAHYAEHLAWLPNIGAGSRPEDRDSNAWTSRDATGYRLSGPPQDLAQMLRQLKRVFDPITLPREFAEAERGILEREYDLRVAGEIDARVALEMNAFLYHGNRMAKDPIGTPASIRALELDAARALHDETHRPERARLVATGEVTERGLAAAMRATGFPDLDARRADIPPPAFALGPPELRVFRHPGPTHAPRMFWRKIVTLPEAVDFDLLAARTALARDVLDSNLPGGLAGPLRFDRFITRSFAVALAPVDERHVELIFAAEPDAGIGFAALQAAFEAALASAAKGIPQTTHDRVRARFAGHWPDWSDTKATAEWMADDTLSRVAALRAPKTKAALRRIDAEIAPADIDALLAALAGPGRTAIAFIGTDPYP